jgi:hypothetical protein
VLGDLGNGVDGVWFGSAALAFALAMLVAGSTGACLGGPGLLHVCLR